MCGIVGFNWDDKALVKKMADRIIHRGPDDSGYFTDDSISLGSRRLSILDISRNGRMPIFNKDRTKAIIFNGEIYNFREIRTDLENRGYEFNSGTDTEVVLLAYEEWGVSCLSRFNGMFALAVWDMEKKELFIARDRLGIKPLYYVWESGMFLFASEMKSFLEWEGFTREIDSDAVNSYFAFKHIPAPSSIFRQVKKLLPGNYILLRKGKRGKSRILINSYWDIKMVPQEKQKSLSEKDIVNTVRNILEDSVKKRLIADVPVGVFLSGGLDSSLITAMMSRYQDDVQTFSMNFEGSAINEGKHAQKVSDIFGTSHHELWLSPEDVTNLLPKIAYHLDEPMNDLASIPSYLLSDFAKKKITVALTGGGADELFVGYRQALMNHYGRFSWPLLKMLRLDSSRGIDKSSRAIHALSSSDPLMRAARWSMIFPDAERMELLSPLRNKIKITDLEIMRLLRKKVSNLDALHQNLYFESKTWLPEILLMEADKMSMMASLESRVPFLDHRLVEFMAGVPAKRKLNCWQTKHLLKKAAKPYLPKSIIHRKKQGFALPILDWLRDDISYYIDNLINNADMKKFINTSYVKKLSKKFMDSNDSSQEGFQIANLVVFDLWYEQFIK